MSQIRVVCFAGAFLSLLHSHEAWTHMWLLLNTKQTNRLGGGTEYASQAKQLVVSTE